MDPERAFIDAGLYDPAAASGPERRELLRHLLDRGFTSEQIIEASKTTIPTSIAARLSLTGTWGPATSLRKIAEAQKVDLALVVRFRQALGFPVPDVDAEEIPGFVADDVGLLVFGCEQFGEEAVLAFARVVGASVARIMDASRAMFASTVRSKAETELTISLRNEVAAQAYAGLHSLIGHQMKESTRESEFVNSLLQGDLRAAVAFVDLVGSTPWQSAQAESEHTAALASFERAAWEAAAAHGVQLVKFIGDEVMLVGADAAATCHAAVAICTWTSENASLPEARGAVGYGPITARDGDYFGSIVNLVARATKKAQPGTVVATEPVALSLEPGEWDTATVGPIPLRGIDEPVILIEISLKV